MMHLGRIETRVEDLEIKPGDIVRLLQPFRPELYGFQEYAFGLVVGVVTDGFSRSKNHQSLSDSKQSAQRHQLGVDGLVVCLYEPDSATTYVDQFGVKALFSFDSDEVALYKAIQTPASNHPQ
jgi:hypothetical protein